MRKIFILIMLFSMSLPVWGELFYSGSMMAQALKIKESDGSLSARFLASIEGDLEPIDMGQFHWELGLRGYYRSQDSSQGMSINEVGISADINEYWSLFIGRKVLYWSRTDEINPIDVINQEDFRRYLVDPKEKRKLGRDMILMAYQGSDRRMDIAFMPRYQAHKLPEAGDIWCASACLSFDAGALVQKISLAGVQSGFKESYSNAVEFAARYSDRWRQLDYGLIAFYGADKFPIIKRTALTPNKWQFERINPSRLSLGFDGATSLGAFAFRWEMLYTHDKVFHLKQDSHSYLKDEDGLENLNELFFVVGVDYSATGNIYTNLQFVKHKIFGEPSSEIIYPDVDTLATWTISKKFHDPDIKITFEVYHDLVDSSDYFILKSEYSFQEQVTLGWSLQSFNGQLETQFGQYDQHDFVSVSMNYLF